LKAKILGTVVLLALAGAAVLVYNWQATLPPVTLTTTATIRTTASVKIASMVGRVRVPTNGCYLGGWIGLDSLNQFEEKIGKRLAIRHIYLTWDSDFPSKTLQEFIEKGNVPLVSWNIAKWNPATKRSNLRIGLQDIIDGEYDEWLSRWANGAKAFGYEMFLRPGYEMNMALTIWTGPNNFGKYGNQSWDQVDNLYRYYGDPAKPDGPERYVDAWKHIQGIFKRLQVSNVEWVWCPGLGANPDVAWNQCENYYPGDEYVDWVGSHGHNYGYWETESGILQSWRSIDYIFERYQPGRVYRQYSSKPFMIAEMGCSAEKSPGVAGEKAAWVIDAFSQIKTKYRNVKAVILFSEDKRAQGDRDFRVDSSPEALEAYRKAISDPYFLEKIAFETSGLTSPSAIFHCAPIASAISRTKTKRDLRL